VIHSAPPASRIVIVSPVTHSSEALSNLWSSALAEAARKRGGPALLATVRGEVPEEQLLDHLIASNCLWSASDGDDAVGFALCRDRVVEALYVDRHHRRQGIARLMLNELCASSCSPLDAYALPGDRAMKSIYESIGWKARLLTMRGEPAGGEARE
jgi:GNAT superfamily N-acetyltransferase